MCQSQEEMYRCSFSHFGHSATLASLPGHLLAPRTDLERPHKLINLHPPITFEKLIKAMYKSCHSEYFNHIRVLKLRLRPFDKIGLLELPITGPYQKATMPLKGGKFFFYVIYIHIV